MQQVPVLQIASAIESRFTLVEGRKMHALVAGHGQPVVLLHGLLGLSSRWRPLMSILAKSARVYAPDTLGMGSSERVLGLDASQTAQARRLRAWLDAEGLAQVDLIGTSHGGALAMRFALMYPERVRKLVLHAPANPFCLGTRPQIRLLSSRIGRFLAKWLPFAPGALHRTALVRMYGDPARLHPDALREYVESMRIPGTVEYVLGVLRRWFVDMASLEPLLPQLQNTRTLLMWGELDRAVSLASGKRLSQLIQTPLHVMQGLGHLAFEEAPEQFATPLLRFLRQGAGVSRTA